MASKLSLYNKALIILGERRLTSEFENRDPRRALDEVYNLDAVNACLEMSRPHFARRSTALTSPTTSAAHALDQVYTLPDDYLDIVGLYLDDTLETPIERYFMDDTRTIACEVATTIYMRYISANVSITNWTPAFQNLVAAYLADHAATRIAPDKKGVAASAFKNALDIIINVEKNREPEARPRKSTFTLTDAWRRVYNKALTLARLPLITSNSDESNARFVLDEAVNNGVVESVLSKIPWDFASVRAELSYDNGYTATFGYKYRFAEPADFYRLNMISEDEYFREPMPDYIHEEGYFYCDTQTIYVRYTDTAHLTAPSGWPDTFTDLVACELAKYLETVPGANLTGLEDKYYKYEGEALSSDAQRGPPKQIGRGNWNRNRRSGHRGGILENGVLRR